MKKMLLLLTVATLGFTTAQAQNTATAPASAQQGPGMGRGQGRFSPEQRADLQTQRLTKQLSLTADQQTKVRTIFLAQANEMETLRGQMTPGSTERQALGQKMQETRTRTDEQLRGVLTPEQFAQYQAKREDQLENRMERREEMKEAKVKAKGDKLKVKGEKDKAKVKAS
ncbi:Spy/CpxP family protein refolding chaperone [Solirubrum puertoriconensis]|uniref:P pilus assembly/Cpx signaling pathway, periplasmic inhibitor/zinc-resistance associated protein n=1 Tax=Solirubrum puertoriconensis TaxID=1751427 RepID=A0A9X0L6F2_SOLP1|nr:hypothetical protein [Solirubrum puertoriconensis]KUG09743.1 hypothetical protein ASU33_18855 [Solirubrum puertoriconensis]